MACHEAVLTGDAHRLITHLEDEILQKAVDALSSFGRGDRDHRGCAGSDLIG